MTVQHNVITDPDIHEPKGVASATSGKVYKSDGTGSGNWVYPLTGLDTATLSQVFESDGSGSGTWKYPPAKGHAEIYINSGTTTHTLGSGSSFSKLNPATEWTASTYEDILTVDAANGEIDLVLAGHYKIDFWCNFTTASVASGAAYKFKFAIDGVVSPRVVTITKPTNGVDTLHVMASGLVEATAGQTLSIYVAGDGVSSSSNITVTEAGLNALWLD
jgi:hypothetical protein